MALMTGYGLIFMGMGVIGCLWEIPFCFGSCFDALMITVRIEPYKEDYTYIHIEEEKEKKNRLHAF